MKFWSALLAVTVIAFMAGCGFAPRGSISGSTDLGTIFVDAPRDVPIAAQLKQEIADRNLALTTDREQANILIRLTGETQSQRILSVKSTGRVSEYELQHSVRLLVAKGVDGGTARYNPEQRANTVTVLREYTYDATGILGKQDEALILREEMREELARNLLLRVVATSRGPQ